MAFIAWPATMPPSTGNTGIPHRTGPLDQLAEPAEARSRGLLAESPVGIWHRIDPQQVRMRRSSPRASTLVSKTASNALCALSASDATTYCASPACTEITVR
jgi:hypothetical protein